MLAIFIGQSNGVRSRNGRSNTHGRLIAAIFVACVRAFFHAGLAGAVATAEEFAEAPSVQQLDEFVKEINEQAATLGKGREPEKVEEKRRQRWEAILKTAAAQGTSGSLWLKAYAAIRDVDGPEDVDDIADLQSVGLLNELKYKAACDRLRLSWREMIGATDGPVLGEVAVRFFEVAQQAKSCYQNALDPGSPNEVATRAELIEALKVADARDPCCIMARPLMLYLSRPDPKEAFLRAEVRHDFKARQSPLVAISHPLILPVAVGGQPGKAEKVDAPVMPWHAIVALDKAISLESLLKDLDYTQTLSPETVRGNSVMPGSILSGSDALMQPFNLIYGRFLVGHAIDKRGRQRSVIMFLNDKQVWEYRYLELLWRRPTEEQLDAIRSLRGKAELINAHAPRMTWQLGNEEFSLYDYPIGATEQLMRDSIQKFCVRSIEAFTKLKFKPNANATDSVWKLAAPETSQQTIRTSPKVLNKLAALTQADDVTKHALIELMNDPTLNPLMIVSDGDKAVITPSFIYDEHDKCPPYLVLDDGNRLVFSVDGNDEASPCCWVDYDGARAVMPLSIQAVPKAILLGTPIGKAFVGLLQDAGYTEKESLAEIRGALAKGDSGPPRKFMKMLSSRVKAQNKTPQVVVAEMLAEKGWQGGSRLDLVLYDLFQTYGFRYVRDLRGNWMINRNLMENAGLASPQAEKFKAYPFDYRTKDGKQRIDIVQMYSLNEYQQLNASIHSEHLTNLLRFHPCLPVLELVKQNDKAAVNRIPKYLKSDSNSLIRNPNEKVYVTSPVARWMVRDDELQQKTLSNLYICYSQQLSNMTSENQWIERVCEWRKEIQITRMHDRTPDQESAWTADAAWKAKLYNECVKNRMEYFEPLLGIQLESARNYARRKYFHKAIVFYNDFLVQLYPFDDAAAVSLTFAGVPTTEQGQLYVADLERLISNQMLMMTAQVELGGTLNAGGLHSSAFFIWQRISDDHKYFLVPSLKISKALLESYGLRLSERAQEAVGQIDSTVRLARDALIKYGAKTDWRVVSGGVRGGDVEAAIELRIAGILAALTLDNDGGLSAKAQATIVRDLNAVLSERTLSFRQWLELKKGLLIRPGLAFRSKGVLSPWLACPQVYDEASGFESAVIDVLESTTADQVVAWCGKPLPEANQELLAARASFLMGWYWMDRGELSLGRAAIINLVNVELGAEKVAGRPMEGLVHEFNAYGALIFAQSIIEFLPGLSGYKVDFSSLLLGQLTDLEKRWFASGGHGPHAAEKRLELHSRALAINTAIEQTNAAWRNDRYFFADYTYEFGAVPDYLVEMLFRSPDLFKPLAPQELAAKGKNATNDRRWALLTPEKVEEFIKSQKIDETLKTEIVFLAD